jgi:NHL repeat
MLLRYFVAALFLLVADKIHAWPVQELPAWREIVTLAGNGQAAAAVVDGAALDVSVSNPFGVEPTADGNLLIVSYDRHVLFHLDLQSSRLRRLAGTGIAGLEMAAGISALKMPMHFPHEVRLGEDGGIFVADTTNHRVVRIDAGTAIWETIAGTGKAGFGGDGGLASRAEFNEAYSIALSRDQLFVADLQNQRVRQVDLKTGLIQTVAGTGQKARTLDGGLASEQPLHGPRSLAVDSDNLWIVLREGNSVWRVDRKTGVIHLVAGTGQKGFSGDGRQAREARLNGPKGIAVDPGKFVYIADTENNVIRSVNLTNGLIDTVAGDLTGKKGFNGDGLNPRERLLARPHGVCLLADQLIIGDSENHRVRALRR